MGYGDGYSWRLLFPPPAEYLKCFHLVRTRFKGDPTCKHLYRKAREGGKKAEMKEEHRLSAFVKLMDFETAIGPKNSLVITPSGIINKNPYFQAARGLLATDLVILNHGQVTRMTPELAPSSPNHHSTLTGGRLRSRQI
ncbi:radial spoke head protein 9 [Trichonephila clavipes]|nr:radial spoke head protein 9 [Trichonephila clavipes]